MLLETATVVATSLATVIATKASEKTGEIIVEAVLDKTKKFLQSLRTVSLETVKAIEQASEQPLDYGEAVLEIEAAAKSNSELAEAMQELSAAVKAQPPSNIEEILQEILESLKSQSARTEIKSKMADNIHAEKGTVVAQNIENFSQTNNYG